MSTLTGKRVAILATDGVEEVELTQPRKAVEDAGATTEIVSLSDDAIQAMNGDIVPAGTYPVDKVASKVSADDYDALLMPGGTVNADRLRMDADVLTFVKDVFAAGKPVGVICHGPWTLVEADLVRGRTLTSFPSLRTDIRNAGGTVVDEEVVTD
ncbi:type 1 glutamine amidotransferase domain-containing protein, partial [Pseudonocardia sp.]|uniref:type 1 glutamine amidotransferase domain-containing protein n=1 Tax=Pseudonocardia sp. TaxID=60912 RepID=UPI0031FD306A